MKRNQKKLKKLKGHTIRMAISIDENLNHKRKKWEMIKCSTNLYNPISFHIIYWATYGNILDYKINHGLGVFSTNAMGGSTNDMFSFFLIKYTFFIRRFDMKETFGQRFARLRKANGFTQDDVANKVNVSSQAVSKWETTLTCQTLEFCSH